MMAQSVPLTVAVPVGPADYHCRWLTEAIESVLSQDVRPAEIILIDDMHALGQHRAPGACHDAMELLGNVRVHRNHWHLGGAASTNVAVALASYDPVIILAGDDRLLPGAVQGAWDTYQRNDRKAGFYWFGVQYSDGRGDQFLQSGCTMATKALWRMTGGYSSRMAFSDWDAALCSILMVNMPDRLIEIEPEGGRQALYWHRVHPDQATAREGLGNLHIEVRSFVTAAWQAPEWGRYT